MTIDTVLIFELIYFGVQLNLWRYSCPTFNGYHFTRLLHSNVGFMKFGNLLATYYEERRAQMELGCDAASTPLQEVPRPTKLFEPRDTDDNAQGLCEQSDSVNGDRRTSADASDLDCVASTSSRSSSTGSDYPHSPVVSASWRTHDNSSNSECVIRTDKPKSYWRATEEEERARESGEAEQRRRYNSGEHNHQQQTTVVNSPSKVASSSPEAEKGDNKKPVRFWLGSEVTAEQHAASINKASVNDTHVTRDGLRTEPRNEPVCEIVREARELCNEPSGDNTYHGMFHINQVSYDLHGARDRDVDTSRYNSRLFNSHSDPREYDLRYLNDEKLQGYRDNYNHYSHPPVLVSL